MFSLKIVFAALLLCRTFLSAQAFIAAISFACVPELLALGDNVKTLGYVATGNGMRASSDVLDDIATYMAFPTTYRPLVIFNPGKTFPSSLVINSANPVGQQIVILHDGPTTLPTSLLEEMAGAGIAATFITSVDNNNAYNTIPPYWEQDMC
ncbi:hypothetical protein BT96DRAFT_948793 [Gymnopus androsaceus JB14]|uniref:Uncharacterized protein n=1 Tax=Gymnopus androsaceus JB14 TaxID=1447944 RepID=A0A6A4GNY2_9AGAR|nr:hypothetical protein BT96DRAFT_948793 [Gymnopus androsaceus JB14]